VVSGKAPGVAWVFIALVFALGFCLLWLAVDSIRRRRALWVDGRWLYSLDSGFVRKHDDPLRFWTWVFIYTVSGLMCIGFPAYLWWMEMR
jgi:hypothetical protein